MKSSSSLKSRNRLAQVAQAPESRTVAIALWRTVKDVHRWFDSTAPLVSGVLRNASSSSLQTLAVWRLGGVRFTLMAGTTRASVDRRSRALATFAKQVPGLLSAVFDNEVYGHMGATISESILQAGINYETVVKPRITRLRAHHPEATTTTAFLHLMNRIHPSDLLNFRGKKPLLVRRTAELFRESSVETEADLRFWIESAEHQQKLTKLSGIGDKTIDYFKLLCGVQTCAIDIHVRRFLEMAHIHVAGYADAKAVVSGAAEVLAIDPASFDRCIWEYMKSRT